jgi:DNA polymerase-3 subunit gamma/tau
MSYVVIARRYRPQHFQDIIGQEHVSKTLSNAIANNRIAHAYIFTGPRGVGKTTSARILAKAVNCAAGPTPVPCNECPSCQAITIGNSLDVLEIDGASNRGIDEIRNLRENIRYLPNLGKFRIYIIDEVHMLTKEAFNALLKTLEEPPAHVLFIFATTEIHRVPATILSRCQRFDFRRIPLKTIMEHLKQICQSEQIEIDEETLLQIAKKADGSMRDSQSILDQIISYCGNKVSFEDVGQTLGIIHQDIFFKISDSVRDKDLKSLILLARDVVGSGYDLTEFLSGLEEHFRNLLVLKVTQSADLLDVSENYLERFREVAGNFTENDLVGYLQAIFEITQTVKTSPQPQLKFEMGLLRLAKMPSVVDIEEILESLRLLKKKRSDAAITVNTSETNAASVHSGLPEIIDFSALIGLWPQIIQLIHQKRPTLSNALENAVLQNLENGVCEVRLAVQNPMQDSMRDVLEKAITHLTRQRIRVKFSFEKEMAASAAFRFDGKQGLSRQEVLQSLRNNDDRVARIIDEFDLELI